MEVEELQHTRKELCMFIVPSSIGILAFLLPFSIGGRTNTLIGHAKEFLMLRFAPEMGFIVIGLCAVVVLINFITLSVQPEWISRHHVLRDNLMTGPFWLVTRFCSLPVAMLVIWGDPTVFGTFMRCADIIVLHLVPRLIMLSLVLSLTAPLLLDFGFVQFISAFASPVMRPLFKVPGRSAVDCMASWLGSSSMAVVLTAKMHGHGHYTDREAAVVVTSFSLAGIYNIYAITALLYMTHFFTQILISVYIIMFVIAVIMPRIWPLNRIPDTYINGMERRGEDPGAHYEEGRLFDKALSRAVGRARHMNISIYLWESIAIALPLLFGTVPLIITFGTMLVTLAESTRLVSVLAAPLSYIMGVFGVGDPEAIGSVVLLAFIDQYLPVAYGQILISESSRFLCICLTVVGMINMTEMGIHIWHSEIPLKFWHMTVLYVIRILLSLFFLIPLSHILF